MTTGMIEDLLIGVCPWYAWCVEAVATDHRGLSWRMSRNDALAPVISSWWLAYWVAEGYHSACSCTRFTGYLFWQIHILKSLEAQPGLLEDSRYIKQILYKLCMEKMGAHDTHESLALKLHYLEQIVNQATMVKDNLKPLFKRSDSHSYSRLDLVAVAPQFKGHVETEKFFVNGNSFIGYESTNRLNSFRIALNFLLLILYTVLLYAALLYTVLLYTVLLWRLE